MNPIYPVQRGATHSASAAQKAKKPAQNAVTAAKINQIVELPRTEQTGLRGRAVTPLSVANDLYKKIRRDWNFLAPEELAEKIIELEDRVSQLNEPSAAVDKIKKLTEHLHFTFVFPVALELDVKTSEKAMPFSFARTIYQTAKRVFDTQSIRPFQELHPIQQQEVMRIAVGRGE